MKFEVRCPSCGKGYLVDELTARGDLPCPGCGTIISSSSPAPPPSRPAAPRPQSAAAAAPERKAPTPAPVAQDTKPEEIVCPRCKLHFVPRRSTGKPAAGERPVVLVVEDMSYFREIATEALAERYEVRTATNLTEARAALNGGDINAMVLDLTLDGGENGAELLRTMATKPCPILIFTAKDESEMYGDSWESLRQLGADDLVMKNINVGESLVRKVAVLLGEEPDDEE